MIPKGFTDEQFSKWLAKEITKVEAYMDYLKKLSRDRVLGRTTTRLDPERPDLQSMKEDDDEGLGALAD